jgi:hypothetical protein
VTAGNRADQLRAERDAPTSEILRSLAEREGESAPLRDVISAMGMRAHGIALILFALPDALPLPIPSLSAILGIPLVVIAGHLVLFGEGSGLPERVLAARIPRSALRTLARFGAPALRALELVSRPRLSALLRYQRVVGLVCLYLALLLLLPIPFVNFPPALCLVVIALGLVQRDGVLVVIGVVLTAALTYSLKFAAGWITERVSG